MIKKTFLLFAFVSVAFFFNVCKKPTDTINDILAGEWIWVKTSGGFAGITSTPDDKDLSRKLNFTDKNVEVKENNIVLGNSVYGFTNKKSFLEGKNTDFVTFDVKNCKNCQLNNEYDFDVIGKDTLVLKEDFNDGFTHIYVRYSEPFRAATYLGVDPKLCPSPCCGGFLFNIDGKTYQSSQLPSNFILDANKKPQKFIVRFKTLDTWNCKPKPIEILEIK
jgi:hypothetical protein